MRGRHYTALMAQAATPRRLPDDEPPVDPLAVQRAYRQQRAKRRARLDRQRARRRAAVRFFFTLALLLGLTVFLGLTVWQEVQRLFGI